MSLSTEVVYEGYDNIIGLQLQVDGVTLPDHTVITRAVLELGRGDTLLSPAPYKTIDSSIDAAYFDLTDATKLILKLGDAGVSKGGHNSFLTVYVPDYPGGLSFGTVMDIRVK
jgi:hypothetical protein